MARRRGIEGTATVLFTINEEGAPQGIRITKSSGSDLLDSAARETISRAAPFPAVKANIEIPITFRLNREE
jgi:protein TonB